MRKSTSLAACLLLGLAALGFAGAAGAQKQPRQVPDDPVPAQAAPGGIQGQNIFDVKPEVRRDASSEPGYMEQNNGQRNTVQPGNNAPAWRGVQQGGEGFTSLPKTQAPEAGILIQAPVQYPGSRYTTAGEAWRQVRNNWIIPYGGALLLIVLLAIGIFYFGKGPLGHEHPKGGRIERFTPFERATHWVNAVAFVILAVSGLIMAFGRFFLLPVIGSALFGWLTYALKTMHNFVGPLFAVSLVIIIVTFIKDNIAKKADFVWLSKAGGMLGKDKGEVPSHRFNAGEKGIFWWGVTIPGVVVVGSGLVLDHLVPGLGLLRGDMQVAHMVHAVAAIWMMALIAGHIYMGTVGVRGAYDGMKTGYVSDSWAREHHELWYEDIQSGKIPAQRSKPLGTAPEADQTVRPA